MSGQASRSDATASAGRKSIVRARSPTDYFKLSRDDLEGRWLRAFRREEVPELGLDTLARALAHNVQELAERAPSRRLRNKIQEFAHDLDHLGWSDVNRAASNRPGARIVKRWKGQTYEVLILDKGYFWQGATYRSLSAIVKIITRGRKMSGPVFFHVKRRRKGKNKKKTIAGQFLQGDVSLEI